MHVPEGKHHPHQHQEQEMAKPTVKTEDSELDVWASILLILGLFKTLPPAPPIATQKTTYISLMVKHLVLSDSLISEV